MRVLLVAHKSAGGDPRGSVEYCGTGCGQAVSLAAWVQCGHASAQGVTGVTVYRHADGSTEHHEWVDRRAVICCGGACVQAGTKKAGAAGTAADL